MKKGNSLKFRRQNWEGKIIIAGGGTDSVVEIYDKTNGKKLWYI